MHAETRITFHRSNGPGHEDRSAIVEQRQRLLNRKQRGARIQAEGRIEMLLGNLAQWDGFAHAGARVQDGDPALFQLDRVEQTVEVVAIRRGPPDAGSVPANQPDSLVERLLPPARDEDIGAFFNEPPGARQCHAARSTRDDCNLTLKLSHDFSFSGVGTASASENLEMGPPESGVECGSAHIGGAKSIRLDDGRQPRRSVSAVRNWAALVGIGYDDAPY